MRMLVLSGFLSAMLVWAIVRRTLLLPYFGGRFNESAGWLAMAVAMLWALHPLQTEAVTYVVQRAESLMGLFYLLTLYLAIRALDSPTPRRWQLAATQ